MHVVANTSACEFVRDIGTKIIATLLIKFRRKDAMSAQKIV